jgi:RNA polymerase sigma factor (sigma-70 family)
VRLDIEGSRIGNRWSQKTAARRVAVKGRTEQRLADLYSSHALEALRLAFVLTGNAEAAEDLVQDAFVRIYARFKEREAPEALYPYLRQTLINLSRDRFRRLRSERSYLANQSRPESPSNPHLDLSERFADAFSRLPHRQKAAIALRYVEDLTEQQTAVILECSVPATKQLIARGTRALREALTEEDQ